MIERRWPTAKVVMKHHRESASRILAIEGDRRTKRDRVALDGGRWRKRLYVVLTGKCLARDGSIQRVTADLGDQNAPNFVTMFHEALNPTSL
jgi:hypothetical protein